ncbi:MAG TPA: ABC transporter permease [Myxococcota bacterium]|nr:ABC transporter permease [Myxococcota bacterium]HRY96152.1 ABC transporter permease [Myxococcota bacterium]
MRSSPANLWARRHLLGVLTVSNLKRQNKSSALGYLWWLLDPLLMTGVYYLVVAVLFHRRGGPEQPYLLFLLCGLLPWKAFSDSIGQSVLSIRGQASIVKAISFPKAVLPLAVVLSNTIYFLVALLVAIGLALYYGPEHGTWPSVYYLLLPVVVLLQVLVTAGLALLVAALGVLFLDTGNITGHLLRMWYFLSPGLYSLDMVPERYRPLFRLNPFAELMTAYRDILMHHRAPAWEDLGLAAGLGLAALLAGYLVFRRLEGRLVQRL